MHIPPAARWLPITSAAHYNRIYSTYYRLLHFQHFQFLLLLYFFLQEECGFRILQMLFLVCLRVWDINLYKQISRKPSQMKLSTYTRRYSDYHIYIVDWIVHTPAPYRPHQNSKEQLVLWGQISFAKTLAVKSSWFDHYQVAFICYRCKALWRYL